MTPAKFTDKWAQVQLSERSAAQQHFLALNLARAGHRQMVAPPSAPR
jgi:hypothetical protein